MSFSRVIWFVAVAGWILPLCLTVFVATRYWFDAVEPLLMGEAPLNPMDYVGLIEIFDLITLNWLGIAMGALATATLPRRD